MQLDVRLLDGLALNWAVALYEPRCRGLTYKVVRGVLCGVGEDDQVCIYLHGSGWSAQKAAQKSLGALCQHAQSYCPVDFWPQAGHLLEAGRLEIGPDGESCWRARAEDLELRGQPCARRALLRAFVLRHAGETLAVPAELEAVLQADAEGN